MRRRAGRPGVALVGLVALGLLVAGCGGEDPASAPASTALPAGTASAGPATEPAAPGVPAKPGAAAKHAEPATPAKTKWGQKVGGAIRVSDVSVVARSTVARIKVYDSATGPTVTQTLAHPLDTGGPLVFLVQERRGDRLRVLLPVRPNESQGWIRAADVKLSELDYRITVSAKAHELRLYRAGKLVMTESVGLGKGSTPTPGGVYYLKELLKPSNPKGAYGPYAYGLSGYSNVLDEFLGGDGQIGIHGTNEPAGLGKDVSHGCIRMRNAAITKLAKMLPLGVPVQMI